MAHNLIYNGLDFKQPDKFGEHTDEQQRNDIQNELQGDVQSSEPQNTDAPEQQNTPQQKPTTHFRTIDDYWKESGLDKIPELQTTKNKKREERAKQQQKYYNLAQGLRTLVQSIGAANGAYETKFEPDRVTPRVQSELARIRDAKDADERRVKLANLNNELKKSLTKIGIMQNEENQKYTDRRYDKRNEYLQNINKENNDFKTKVAEIKGKYSVLEQYAKTQGEKEKLKAQERKEITVAAIKAGYSQEEIDNVLNNKDAKFDKPLTNHVQKTTKPAMTIIKNGKSVDLTQSQVEDEVFRYLQKMKQLSETNPDEYAKLPLTIRKAIEMNEKLTAAQKRDIVRMIYADTNDSLYPDEEESLYPEN